LAKVKSIIIGDYGEVASESTFIDLPAGATISLGRSAAFSAQATTSNSFENLKSLFVGPASTVSIAAAVTFGALETLTLQDGATLRAKGGYLDNLPR
jgi:hypothetical protein